MRRTRRSCQRRSRFVAVAAVLLAVVAGGSEATTEYALEVLQPIVTEEGVFLSAVTFVKFTGGPSPGGEVGLVGAASWVADEVGKPVNRNAANLVGIRTGVHPFHVPDELFGDTLKVFMDLSKRRQVSTEELLGSSADTVVVATAEAVLQTAVRHRAGRNPDPPPFWVDAKYIQLDVRGDPAWAHLGGVFSAAALEKRQRRRFGD